MRKLNKIHELILMNHINSSWYQNLTKKTTGRPRITEYLNIYKSILFKVRTGVNWEDTKIYGNYSVSTVYNYFVLWNRISLFENVNKCILNFYSKINRLNWQYLAIDSTTIKCYRGGDEIGPNSTDRGRNGCKIHSISDGNGIPLAVFLSKANFHDSKAIESLMIQLKKMVKKPSFAASAE